MFVYRIANIKYKETILSGIGAEKVGGRWNTVGTRAVYCSENISLALLEYYVHSKNIDYLPKHILVAKIYIPDELILNEVKVLPKKWNHYPYSLKTTKIFTNLSKKRNFLGLKVPSTIIEMEYNIILNPLYKDFGKVEIVEFITLPIDDRLR